MDVSAVALRKDWFDLGTIEFTTTNIYDHGIVLTNKAANIVTRRLTTALVQHDFLPVTSCSSRSAMHIIYDSV